MAPANDEVTPALGARGRQARILLLEDEADLAVPVARVLERAGFHVVCAANVRDARAAFDPDLALVILDVMLPEGADAGFVFARSLAESGYRGKLLCVTARDSAADRLHALEVGVDDVVIKPFSLRTMLAVVRRLVGS